MINVIAEWRMDHGGDSIMEETNITDTKIIDNVEEIIPDITIGQIFQSTMNEMYRKVPK